MSAFLAGAGVSMRELCIAVAEATAGEPQKVWFWRGARRAGITPRQFRAIYRGEITDPEHKSVRRLWAVAERRKKNGGSHGDTRAKSIESLLALRGTLAQIDQDYHRETIALIDVALRDMGVGNRAVGGGRGAVDVSAE